MASYEAKRLVNVTEEPAFEQASAMSEARSEAVSEVTWKSSNPTNLTNPTNPQPASNTISRVNSDLSLYNTPVRRRSVIQKPGVATRARESPAPSMPSFRYSHPPTPGASRKQSVESLRGGVVSMPPPRIIDSGDIPRVVTPCEADYQSIGAFKLGSLRITNGAASPSSLETRRSHKKGELSQNNSREQIDYITETLSVLGYHDRSEAVDDRSHTSEEPPAKIQAPRPRTLDLGTIAKIFQGIGSEKAKSDAGSVVKELSPRVVEPSPQYLAEMTFTPFSLAESRPTTPELQITSKHTALEDSLFEDDGPAEYSTAEILDVRLDPNARPPSVHVVEDAQASQKSVARTDSGFVSTASPSSEYSHRPLTKADSGYGSNVSLRSFTNSRQDKEFSLSLDRRLLSTKSRFSSSDSSETQPRSPVSSTSKDSHPLPPDRTAPAPPVPPKDSVPLSPSRVGGSSTGKSLSNNLRSKEARLSSHSISRQSRHTPSPILSLRSSENAPKSPDSTPKTPLSAKSDTSTSALSIGSGSHKPNKLQRLLSGARRSSNGPPMVHVTHITDKGAIPSIPRDVETKLREHTGLFPITTKRLALKTQLSRDTLKTIFSVGSVDQNLDVASGVPSVSTVAEIPSGEMAPSKAILRKYNIQDLPSPRSVAAAHLFPGKAITRKPVPTRHSSLKAKEKDGPRDAEGRTGVSVHAEPTSYDSVNNVFGNNSRHAAFNALSEKERTYFSPTGPSRTMSLTSSSGRHPEPRRIPYKSKSSTSLADPGLFPLPSPLLPKQMDPPMRPAGAPPVNMLVRRPMSLRIPPPLRHRPAPADAEQQPTLSRKSSREHVQSYPPSSGPSLTHQTSRERIRSYPPSAPYDNEEESTSPPPIPPQNPRRAMSLRSRPSSGSQQMPPNWEVQTDHGFSARPKRYSFDGHGGANSLSSNQNHNGDWVQRPSTAHADRPHRDQPPLRHRSSYDGSGRSQRRGNPPTMSNGYTAPLKPPYDPLGGLQYAPSSQQWDQYGRYPPVPRGHYRNRSMGTGYIRPNAPPYRVLHSYNSPAYRNAPIWG